MELFLEKVLRRLALNEAFSSASPAAASYFFSISRSRTPEEAGRETLSLTSGDMTSQALMIASGSRCDYDKSQVPFV